jgi:hypothetical protein
MTTPTAQKTPTDNVTLLKEATGKVEGRVQKIKSHPMTKRLGRNSVRFGIVGIGYTLMDEAFNATSWNANRTSAVLWTKKN